jgi:hypothetical protein
MTARIRFMIVALTESAEAPLKIDVEAEGAGVAAGGPIAVAMAPLPLLIGKESGCVAAVAAETLTFLIGHHYPWSPNPSFRYCRE